MRFLLKPLFLIGLPGSGKTTVGQQLSEQIGVPFTDLDDMIVSTTEQSIASIFQEKGEDFFRHLEAKCLQSLLNTQSVAIVSVGGGTPCFFDNMEKMKAAGITCYLETSWVTLASRGLLAGGSRPLFQGLDPTNAAHSLEAKFGWRIPFYQQADWSVNTDNKSITEILSAINSLLSKAKTNRN